MNELLKKLLAALGLSETASEEETLAAVEALKSAKKAVEGQAAASAAVPDPTKYVPVEALAALSADHQTLQGKFTALSTKIEGDALSKLVNDGLAAGKLTPALEPWAREQSVAALSAFLEKATPVVVPGNTQTGGQGSDAGTGIAALSADQKAICKQLNIGEAEFLATLNAGKE